MRLWELVGSGPIWSDLMVAAANKKARVSGVPKLSELLREAPSPVRPSNDVLRKLGNLQVVAGVDIETDDWEEVSTGGSMHRGQYGFLTRCRPDVFEQRIVQIGWAIGDVALASPLGKCRELTIKPESFKISEKATKLHGITNQDALNCISLQEALVEFIAAM